MFSFIIYSYMRLHSWVPSGAGIFLDKYIIIYANINKGLKLIVDLVLVWWSCPKALSGRWEMVTHMFSMTGSQEHTEPYQGGHDASCVPCCHVEELTSAVDGAVGGWGVRGQREQTDPTVWLFTHQSQPRVLHTEKRKWGLNTNFSSLLNYTGYIVSSYNSDICLQWSTVQFNNKNL